MIALTAALSIVLPHGWHLTTAPQMAVTDPVQRFALYSGARLPATGSPRQTQVVAVLMEQEPPAQSGFPTRPRLFHLPRCGTMENLTGDRWGEIVFRDHKRSFYLFVWVGRSATAQILMLLTALDSLRVS